jgi:hypothetical protein
MMDDQFEPDANDAGSRTDHRREQTPKEPSGPQRLGTQPNAPKSAPQPQPRVSPGRRPLFRS